MKQKQFTVSILVHEDDLYQAHMDGHDQQKEDCPDLEEMILSELQWLTSSGISIIGNLNEHPPL
ncbi:MAG: hypothetical protein KME09_07195 [Pleurocapsa minor HA4230-MV1]|jgi:hypothetical protein|nr:hypothetical protein [Pleurocapsa minor HA4230-MV1]